jgi:hypothetical protein
MYARLVLVTPQLYLGLDATLSDFRSDMRVRAAERHWVLTFKTTDWHLRNPDILTNHYLVLSIAMSNLSKLNVLMCKLIDATWHNSNQAVYSRQVVL